jgi:hypothetical protein
MGFFSRSGVLQAYAKAAEVYAVVEDGNYKAFIVKVSVDNKAFSSALKAEGQNELGKFAMIIDDRIINNQFEDPLLLVENLYGPDASIKKNYSAKRIVISMNEEILFSWSDNN